MTDRYSFDPEAFGVGGLASPWMVEGTPYADLSMHGKAVVQAWHAGCPVPEALIEERGADAMADRYGELNQAFFAVVNLVQEVDPNLAQELMAPAERQFMLKDGKKVARRIGKYEEGSVPEKYLDEMSPMGTLVGYALPRLFVEDIRSAERLSGDEVPKPYSDTATLLKVAAGHSDNAYGLLAVFAELLAELGHTDVTTILQKTLSQGWYEEHEAREQINAFSLEFKKHAPRLWEAYTRMTVTQRIENGII